MHDEDERKGGNANTLHDGDGAERVTTWKAGGVTSCTMRIHLRDEDDRTDGNGTSFWGVT